MSRTMQQFNFKVVNSADADADVPVLVASQIMVDIQNLLADVGELMVRQELRTQNSLPEGVRDRFTLRMKGSGGAGTRTDGALIEDALTMVCAELDRANLNSTTPAESGNHIEAIGRSRIAGDMLALADHLEGHTLFYGSEEGGMRRFRMNARTALEKEAAIDVSSIPSAIIGTISRDPVKRNRWVVSNGVDTAPLAFSTEVRQEDIDSFESFGPLIVVGTVSLDGNGGIAGVRDVTSCYQFPIVRFHRIIGSERDILLFNPVPACVSYNAGKGVWTLVNEDLGISESKPSWDAAVMAFHEYFLFLWETYAESDEEFEGEELEVRDYLRSMAFP